MRQAADRDHSQSRLEKKTNDAAAKNGDLGMKDANAFDVELSKLEKSLKLDAAKP